MVASYTSRRLMLSLLSITSKRSVCTTVCRSSRYVLGIETSCDDTGAAVVDDCGNILGDSLASQGQFHVELGGIIPPLARDLHKKHIKAVVGSALEKSGLQLKDVDAIATTVKPGLAMSLNVGLEFARNLVHTSGKPFIPIHHMEAHALMARMTHSVRFPFLVLLVSGGHCLLAVARGVDDFLLLGQSTDIAPGDAFDKTARRLKLLNIPSCYGLSGGQSVELMAQNGDSRAFTFRQKVHGTFDCDFSFSGLRTTMESIITKEEAVHDIRGGNVLPNVADICASFQHFVLRHLVNRLQRGFLYCDQTDLLPRADRALVVSGGVASNSYLRRGLLQLCEKVDAELVCPPPHLCTDNGIMVAWNGMEKLLHGPGFVDPESVDIETRSPLGTDISPAVKAAGIKVKRMKLINDNNG